MIQLFFLLYLVFRLSSFIKKKKKSGFDNFGYTNFLIFQKSFYHYMILIYYNQLYLINTNK